MQHLSRRHYPPLLCAGMVLDEFHVMRHFDGALNTVCKRKEARPSGTHRLFIED